MNDMTHSSKSVNRVIVDVSKINRSFIKSIVNGHNNN